MHYLLTFRSLTYAQRAARVLERAGITATVSRVPKAAAAKGCGYCLIVPARHRDWALTILTGAGLKPERMLLRHPDGTLEGVE